MKKDDPGFTVSAELKDKPRGVSAEYGPGKVHVTGPTTVAWELIISTEGGVIRYHYELSEGTPGWVFADNNPPPSPNGWLRSETPRNAERGDYKFALTVIDGLNRKAVLDVTITVT